MYWLLIYSLLFSSLNAKTLEVDSKVQLQRLMTTMDKDNDKKITIDDKLLQDATFILETENEKLAVRGTFFISNLAQELKWLEASHKKLISEYIFENPIDRISRSIRTRYWDGLTRRIDQNSFEKVVADSKFSQRQKFLYVPFGDQKAFEFYSRFKKKDIKVVRLPQNENEFEKTIQNNHGLLSLAVHDGKSVPYVVPGGRFNEMYGWDSYFHVLGTIIDGRLDLAEGIVENFIYEIEHYGKILNANRTYYLSRSQPPFFTSMVKAVYREIPKNAESKNWLERSLSAAIKEYETVWMGKDRLIDIGLSRYAGIHHGIPPEVEIGHFNHFLQKYLKKYKTTQKELIHKINSGEIKNPEITEFFNQDRALRESGHDTTYRFKVAGVDRASDFVTVDLNSLLYKYELDLAFLIQEEFDGNFKGHNACKYFALAQNRRNLIRKYLWDSKKNIFYDYNFVTKKRSNYLSATTFYPLWASNSYPEKYNILNEVEATALVKKGLIDLEQAGGLSATSRSSLESIWNRKEERQWDYPNGWAPHQIIAWVGMKHYGFNKDSDRLIYKWLYVIAQNASDYNGTIPEKYNVVTKSHKVFTEYGNVGTKFSYITTEGFGWMNASFQMGLSLLPKELKQKLRNLTPPEWVFNLK
jgi:alpha,alpha-trehalase